jgi:hypothetical protein
MTGAITPQKKSAADPTRFAAVTAKPAWSVEALD